MEDTLLAKLQSLTEQNLLSKVLVPLFSAMGFDRVAIEGGPFEKGRDLICSRQDSFGQTEFTVVQVKRFKPSARASSSMSFAHLMLQLAQATESKIAHLDGKSYLPSYVVFVTPYAIDTRALESRFEQVASLQQLGVRIVDGPRLVELLNRYLPELSHQLSGHEQGASISVGKSPRDDSQGLHEKPDRDIEVGGKGAFDYLNALHQELGQFLAPADDADPKLCFVIMSFSGDPRLADFYEMAIKPTVNGHGYRCERVDEQQFNGSIRQQILQNIRRARFVVADMTEARPNCYYELGVAHATRKEVIHLAYSVDDVHFDVKDLNFIIYSRIDELSDALSKRIMGTVGPANNQRG